MLKTISSRRHYPCSRPHKHFKCLWQVCGACGDGILAVLSLFIAHGRNDCATARVVSRQLLQVAVKMIADLPLGFRDETETPFVADYATQCAHRKRSGVPDRAKPARSFTQFIEALLAPREVIEFLVCGLLHLRFNVAIARDGRVALVEPLRGNLAGVIDAHQAGGMRLLLRVEAGFGDIGRRARPRGQAGRGRHGSQRVIHTRKQSIERCQVSWLHTDDYTNDNARRFPNDGSGENKCSSAVCWR